MKPSGITLALALATATTARLHAAGEAPLPEPPPLPKREVAPAPSLTPETVVELTNGGVRASLFLPQGWNTGMNRDARLVVHFHTVAWFAIREHVRRGSKWPLLNFALGEGSFTYAKPFQEPARFQDWLRSVAAELKKHGAPADTRVAGVDVSSFSAGYGAVREILKLDANRAVIQRVLLCDSLYGGLRDTNAPPGQRRVVSEHIEPWLPYVRAAVRGEKTFLLTTSDIQTQRYASTRECGDALAAAVGARFADVPRHSCAAAHEADYPLLRRADVEKFHVWNYAGTNGPAHLTHVRHLADLWAALDACDAVAVRETGGLPK